MIDTHAHLNTIEYINDLDEVIHRAKNVGVEKIILVGMDLKHNQKALELSLEYPIFYPTVGIHPCSVDEESLDDLYELAKNPRVVAIGETGIDLYWRQDNLALQQEVFKKQIELAIQLNKPIIIHTRSSFNEAYEVIKPYKGQIKGVFHSFSSTLEDALKVIELGLYIGISGVVTFKKALEIKQIVEHIDLKHILLETDSPYLSPSPYRGKRNESAYTHLILEEVARIKQIDPKIVEDITNENAKKLFGLES